MSKLFDAAYTATRNRVEAHGEDWLTAAFLVVERLTPNQCRKMLDEVYGKPLVQTDTDIVRVVATRVGVSVNWRRTFLEPTT